MTYSEVHSTRTRIETCPTKFRRPAHRYSEVHSTRTRIETSNLRQCRFLRAPNSEVHSTRTRIETVLLLMLVKRTAFIQKYIPPEQGLKLQLGDKLLAFVVDSEVHSTRTRIETCLAGTKRRQAHPNSEVHSTRTRIETNLATIKEFGMKSIQKYIPPEQGLKRIDERIQRVALRVRFRSTFHQNKD